MTFKIELNTNPNDSEIARVYEGLTAYNRSIIPDKGYVPLLFTLLAEDGSLAGGLHCYISYGWLYINTLWIADGARSQGYGRRLMLAAEQQALNRGCRRAWVDTFSFQARKFYEKLGYVVFGELEDYPPGYQRFFLRKTLAP